jgi:phosphotransferase system  glucose/maltose/N-acetylglucosamine-specific IIC component
MKVNWRVNLIFGIIAGILTYGFSIANNTWLPSLFRALLGLLLFAVLGCILQFVLRFIASMKDQGSSKKQETKVDNPLEPNKEHAEVEDVNEEPLFQSLPIEALQKGKRIK